MSKLRQQNGFSFIELLLVLAISGALVLIIFIALRQATRNSKNDAIIRDAGRYLAAAQQWVNDNNGNLPTAGDLGNITTKYITSSGAAFESPYDGAWVVTPAGAPTDTPGPNPEMIVASSATCNASNGIDVSPPTAHLRKIAVAVQLVGGEPVCITK